MRWIGPRNTAALVVSATALLALTPTSARAQAQAASPEVRDAGRHVVTLQAYDHAGNRTEQGSGFHLSDGKIATNSHVVAGAERVEILDAAGDRLGTARFARALDPHLDLAILPAPAAGSAGLPLSRSTPEVGDPVWVYGSPKGLGGTMSTGIVSAIRTQAGRRMVQISAPISPGSSGGPVLNARGEVVGVTVASIVDGQNLNFAVPSTELAALAARVDGQIAFPGTTGVALPLGPDWYRQTTRLADGARVEGRIEASDFTLEGRPFDVYWFDGVAGQTIEVEVASGTIDPYVVVTDLKATRDAGGWTRADDDGGEGTNARLVAELPATSSYMVLVSSYDRTPGAYTIAVTLDSPGGSENPASERRPNGVPPERWQFIARNASNAELYYDRQSMSERDGSVRVWVLTQYPSRQALGRDAFDASKALFEIRCGASEYRLNQYLLLRDTEVIGSDGSLGEGEWSAVPPDSVAEGLLTSLCI